MSKTRETSVWQWLSKGRRPLGPSVFLERIENSVGDGTPDVRGTYLGRDFWIELKSAALPARLTTPVQTGLRLEQEEWAKAYIQAGGRNLFMLIRVAASKRLLIPGRYFESLRSHPIPYARLAELSLTPPDASPVQIIERASTRY